MTRHQRRTDNGFTLIELLVVVIVLGVLAAVAVPVFLNQRDKAAKGVTAANLRNLMADVQTARDNRQAALIAITGTCSNCPCRDLANPLKVDDPSFAATPCGAAFTNFTTRLAAASGASVESIRAMTTDGWGYPMLPDENEGMNTAAWDRCGDSNDEFRSGGKDHIISYTTSARLDDIARNAPASGYCTTP